MHKKEKVSLAADYHNELIEKPGGRT